ncbi:hypothetical protein M440DRAFT_1398050 [Trichoderma longibrachiatum ATCC 18648]|uniref:Uncharacterized protein n=1 Tax=Trichoderma longibrachiatum ATCC 18648 TaxID=983965 RepID=A0A2T4CGJ7_TRILO|nr:hypothetical protein M440DRAFT_1398050 [Trichoderma longibrachiatum ATCC 18648]
MCEVTRTKYSCRHNTITYTTRCAHASSSLSRCEKKISTATSSEKCPKCSPDSRHKQIADLYATYGVELARLTALARAQECQVMVTQLEGIRRGLAEERTRALVELEERIEGEEGERRRVEEEVSGEGGW